MKFKYSIPIVALVSILCLPSIYAQKIDHKLLIGFGYSEGTSLKPIFNWDSYDYHFSSFRLQINYTFHQSRKFDYELCIEPSYYRTTFSELNDPKYPFTYNDINEFALNIGFISNWRMGDMINIYGLLSSGPEYLDIDTTRQKGGFAMSNILALGFRLNLNRIALDFRSGIRHVSNAGINKPNLGYNCRFSSLMVLFKLNRKNRIPSYSDSLLSLVDRPHF